ncbi:MAG: MBL fold metallo-hydrolase [Alphaproteobacteria bacterium]|nr:MBL fold metallo-hydrolase [Alphaproteobacteria bacterium]
MKVTILGCGSSGGVPLIGENWGNCDPSNPRNRRMRASILIEDKTTTVLIDTSPDMRQQCLDVGLKKLDAVLFTHSHADHCHGIDELRSVNWLICKPIDIYVGPKTLAELKLRFAYIFQGAGRFYKPSVIAHEINGPFTIGRLDIVPFVQSHGDIKSLGYRIGDFAYSTDVSDFDENALSVLKGIKTWILDSVRIKPHPTHFSLSTSLEWIKKIKPDRAYLTHLNHTMDYDELYRTLPKGVEPAYDGMVIEC